MQIAQCAVLLSSYFLYVPATQDHLEEGQEPINSLEFTGAACTGVNSPVGVCVCVWGGVKYFTNIPNKAKKGICYRLREATATGPVRGGTGGGGEPMTISGSWENL